MEGVILLNVFFFKSAVNCGSRLVASYVVCCQMRMLMEEIKTNNPKESNGGIENCSHSGVEGSKWHNYNTTQTLNTNQRSVLLGQWLNFKLFGITYFIGKIKFKLLFQGPLAKWLFIYCLISVYLFVLKDESPKARSLEEISKIDTLMDVFVKTLPQSFLKVVPL